VKAFVLQRNRLDSRDGGAGQRQKKECIEMFRRDGSFGDATHGTPNSVGLGKPTGRESERKETMHDVAFKHLLIFSLSSAVNEWHSPIRAKKYRYYWYAMYVRTGRYKEMDDGITHDAHTESHPVI
jgi:hypothetical protein